MNKKIDTTLHSVTTICCSHIDKHWFPAGCAERGSKVHLWANRFLNGVWDPFIEKEFPEYVGGLKNWLETNKARIIFGEGILTNHEEGFNGHPDFIGTIKDEEGIGLIDFKTSNSPQTWWPIQLAAYTNLAECNKEETGVETIEWAASLSVNKEGACDYKKYTKKELTGSLYRKFLNLLYYYRKVYTLAPMEENEFTKHIQKLKKKNQYSNRKIIANYIRYDAKEDKSYFNNIKGA